MVLSDFTLLVKKIIVAMLVAFIPLLILLTGAWFTQQTLKSDKHQESLPVPNRSSP